MTANDYNIDYYYYYNRIICGASFELAEGSDACVSHVILTRELRVLNMPSNMLPFFTLISQVEP